MRIFHSLILFAFLPAATIGAFTIMVLVVDSGSNEVTGVRNCTGCLFGTLACDNDNALNTLCSCEDVSADDIRTHVGDSANHGNMTWYYSDPTILCCLGSSHNTGQEMLTSLLDYSYGHQFTIKLCHNLNPLPTSIAMYGVREFSVTSDTNSNFPLQNVYMSDTDLSGKTQAYREHHLVLIGADVFNGDKEVKSWSSIDQIENEDLNEKVATAVQRAPQFIKAKDDGTFMFTPIYV